MCLQCFDAVGWAAERASGLQKTEWWGAGVVFCLERDADLHTAQLMPLPLTVSCFSKIQTGFTFLVPAHMGNPGKRAVKWVCVFYGLYKYTHLLLITYYDVHSLTGQCYELNIPSTWTLCGQCNRQHTRDDNTGSAAVQNSVHHTADCKTASSLKYSQRWHLPLLLLATTVLWPLYCVPAVLRHCWLGGRKGIRPVENWVVWCWRGYLSGARCRLAYDPADATATHCLLLQ